MRGPCALAAAFCAAGAGAQQTPPQLPTQSAATSAADDGKTLPVWEVGVAVGAASLPDYPGADQNHVRVIPFPYFLYRGKVFRSDSNGVRATMHETPLFRIEFSAAGAANTNSSDNHARSGMPDLDYLGEFGPQLRVALADLGDTRRLSLLLPLRVALSTNLKDFNYRGYVFAPEVSYVDRHFLDAHNTVGVAAGPTFASAALLDYYYSVAQQYATPERAEYQAHGGYLGSHVTVFASHRFTERWSAGVFAAVDVDTGATNADSPLFRDDVNWSTGFGVSWSFYSSKSRTSDLD